VYGAVLATVLALACPAPAAAQTAPDCDTTGNSEILRTGKPITLSVDCFDAESCLAWRLARGATLVAHLARQRDVLGDDPLAVDPGALEDDRHPLEPRL